MPTPHRVRWSKHKLAWCGTCGRRRRLGNLRVQVFYDALKFYCSEPCKRQRRRR